MRKFRIIVVAVLLLALVAIAILFVTGYFKPKGAGIFIETSPAASVFIDGEQVGRTPYKETRKPKEIVVKLVPESFDKPLSPYEARITLVSGIETVVRREFAESEDLSSGEILSFEKIGGGKTSLSIVSVPDSAQISIDGITKAFAPYKTSTLTSGKHTIVVSAPGFIERTLEIQTVKGYKLIVAVQLALSQEPVELIEEELPEPEEEEKPEPIKIEILETPTSFLRVRSEPSTLGEEVGRVEPGDQFVLLDEDEKTGWYKIEYEEGEGGLPAGTGWISNTYAKKLGEESIASPSATPSSR